MFIKILKKKFQPDTPIFINEILILFPNYSRTYIYRLIKIEESKKKLAKYSRGVYYIPTKTRWGMSTINTQIIFMKKYVTNGKDYYGAVTGLTVLNGLGVSTQVPNIREYVSNNETSKKRTHKINNTEVIVKKPRCIIDNDNAGYYQILELFTQIKGLYEIGDVARYSITDIIKENNMNYKGFEKLFNFFPKKAVNLFKESNLIQP